MSNFAQFTDPDSTQGGDTYSQPLMRDLGPLSAGAGKSGEKNHDEKHYEKEHRHEKDPHEH